MATLTVNYKDRFLSLKERAEARKSSKDLRHTPNDNDIRVASSNAKDIQYHQYETIRR